MTVSYGHASVIRKFGIGGIGGADLIEAGACPGIFMIKLSKRTQDVINCLYVSEGERRHIAEVLETRCADKIPFCDRETPESMERIRFAVLKLTAEKGMLDHWIEEVSKDWRDVLMAADFGCDVSAHLTWFESIMRSRR